MKMKKKITLLLLLFIQGLNLLNAQIYTPAKKQSKSILLKNATVHTGNGKVMLNTSVGFRNGIIDFVGSTNELPSSAAYDSIADLSGKNIYPGLVACNTIIGLSEIEALRAANDFQEVGSINSGARSLIAYNTDSKVIPTLTVNGVLTAQVVPQGGLVSGISSVVALDAWNWEDAAIASDNGVHINWPSTRIINSEHAGTPEVQRERYDKNFAQLDLFFRDARAYALATNPKVNLNLASAAELFSGKKKLFVHARYVKDMLAAIAYFEQLGLNFVFVGAEDCWMIADMLATKKIPVVLMRTHDLPEREDEAIDQVYRTPAILKIAGVEFAIAVDGFWQVRTLSYNAGSAVAYGLSKEEALSAISGQAAKILGVDHITGSIEKGKQASLLITQGDLLDMKDSKISDAFIQGRRLKMENYQDLLYQKYLNKYELSKP